jgi:lipoyl(octanoyl) transferase
MKKSINNIPVNKVNRGGKITYHGPGQLIIYPLLNIKKRNMNIIDYINLLEDICIKVFNNNSIKLN